jgi:predicted DCC family thiol-disulfide oxidoreductase YuxK
MSPTKLTIYYDGACHLCSREIAMYQKARGAEALSFIDICATGFDAVREGLDPFEVHKSFHARAADGTLYSGVPAFVAIWETLPGYHWMAKMTRIPGVRPLLDLSYVLFTKVRPILPRKKFACDGSPYCEIPVPRTKT